MPDETDILEKFKEHVRPKLFEMLDLERLSPEVTEEERARINYQLEGLVTRAFKTLRTTLTPEQHARVVADLNAEVLGLGPLEPLLNDPSVTEIMVNGPAEVFAERQGRIERVDTKFRHANHILYVVERILAPIGRRLTHAEPYVNARLPDGSRINVAIAPIAVGGPYVTIRKFSRELFTLEDLIRLGTLTEEIAAFLRGCVKARLNIVMSGAASSGKTTLLNVLVDHVDSTDRIIVIEDTTEIQLRHHHVARLEARPASLEGNYEVTIRDLVKNALRMRPDRIIVGEVRGEEALDMLQAMNTGHDGSMTTLHANNPTDVMDRIETMALMSPMKIPPSAVERQVRSAIDLIVHLQHFSDGARRVTHIAEVRKGRKFADQPPVDLFVMDRAIAGASGRLLPTGETPSFLDRFEECKFSLPAGLFHNHRG
jgi:pilus assembly protein CpaF